MSIDVNQLDGNPLELNTFRHWLKALNWKMDFVSNSRDGLIYQSGDVTVTMHGFVAGNEGEEPKGWDLNNSQIRRIEFSDGNQALEISGFAMDLRETINATSLDSFRNWRHLSPYGHYQIQGSDHDDKILGADDGKNLIVGGLGDDEVYSTGIGDRIHGGGGHDIIHIANDGQARIWGGAGGDIFIFEGSSESNSIRDFRQGTDLLDVGKVAHTLAMQADAQSEQLKFVSHHRFSGEGLELGFERHHVGDGEKYLTTVEVSVDGAVSDLITLRGDVELTKSDFLF